MEAEKLQSYNEYPPRYAMSVGGKSDLVFNIRVKDNNSDDYVDYSTTQFYLNLLFRGETEVVVGERVLGGEGQSDFVRFTVPKETIAKQRKGIYNYTISLVGEQYTSMILEGTLHISVQG